MGKKKAVETLLKKGMSVTGDFLKEANLPESQKIIQKIKKPSSVEKFNPENQELIKKLKAEEFLKKLHQFKIKKSFLLKN